MIHPTIPAEIPGIELESDLATPSRLQVRSDKLNMADRASAAQFSAGLDDESQTNKETRGVDDASDANNVVNDDADQGVDELLSAAKGT